MGLRHGAGTPARATSQSRGGGRSGGRQLAPLHTSQRGSWPAGIPLSVHLLHATSKATGRSLNPLRTSARASRLHLSRYVSRVLAAPCFLARSESHEGRVLFYVRDNKYQHPLGNNSMRACQSDRTLVRLRPLGVANNRTCSECHTAQQGPAYALSLYSRTPSRYSFR